MSKTITLRVDDDTYNIFKRAADGERRTISNFIEYATISYLSSESYVSDSEMKEILEDKALLKALRAGERELEQGKYSIVE